MLAGRPIGSLRKYAQRSLFLGLLVFSVGTAQAQPVPCKVPEGATFQSLEERRVKLEREVGRETAQTPEGRAKAAPAGVRRSQEELLEVLFHIDCLKATAAPMVTRSPAPTKRSAAPAPGAAAVAKDASLIEVMTYYATNRKPTGNKEPASFYGSEAEIDLRYGSAVVTIPPNHTPGNLELPNLWKLERQPDPSKHFVLKSVTPLSGDAVRAEMAGKLQSMDSKALLLFVHGYNTNFDEAALRTAQLAHDLRFPGMAFFYSWPSAGKILGYWQDEETAQLSEGVLEQLLDELSQLPVTDIYLVAHSMGTRIVTSALRTRIDKNKDSRKVRELLLAAPDINSELFRRVIAPKLATLQGMRTTVYASSSDLALKASKVVHGFKRVGETAGEIFVYPGLDTIDASSAATMSRAYGHSYLMDSAQVLRDIRALVEEKFAAKQRGLREMGVSPNQYWFLQ